METETLTNFNENETGFVVSISGPLHLKRRLLDLGFTQGAMVRVINISPLKNSFLLEIHGYIIALRQNAVKNIQMVRT